jgi:hypothetical protein
MIHSSIHALVRFSIRTEGFLLLSIKDGLEFSFIRDGLDGGNICSLKLREGLRGLLICHIVLVSLAQSVKYIKIIELLLNRGSIGLSHVLHAAMIVHSRLGELTPIIGIFISKFIIL